VYELVRHLSALDRENTYFLYFPRTPARKADSLPYCPDADNFRLRPVAFPERWVTEHPSVWWDYWLPLAIRRDRLDVFHSPNYFLPRTSVGTVVTIHDLAFFKIDLYSTGVTQTLRHWTERALRSATRVIALSEHSRRDIDALGIVAPDRVQVIYGGGHVVPDEQIEHHRMAELRSSLKIPNQYILFVGVLHPRKNIPFLLRSFARLKRETDLPHGLVLAGMKGPAATEIEQLIVELGIEQDVIVTGYLADWQVPLLYLQADLFVLPTLYEGFTLVTLEAMHYGVPVVATDCSSVREGVGNAATLVPCDDVDALTAAIHELLVDANLREQRVTAGRAQAARFGWDRCASDTLRLYRDVYAHVVS
jgi:glycosyltransferase involved in cell wall biosynthesis